MVDILPIHLTGDNLGKRHQCLNSLVAAAFHQHVPLQTILDLPEENPIDRVFKIQLASKHKNVEYIISQLKERDMLFVSKALKSCWLLEPDYSFIINPINLETNVYPFMTTVAVNKVKNWIELNLKDPKRCQDFYVYYKNNFDVAIKFLWHCSNDFITEQILKILDKLKPKHLRILSEKCPEVAKVYFDGLPSNKEALLQYLREHKKYNDSFKSVLKKDGNLYLDIAENHFNHQPLSSSATKYIMNNYKQRYLNKPEFYTALLLDVKSLASFLSSEEIKDIVEKLAAAEYLRYGWFTYKRVEPLIKCLSSKERTEFKKKVFVDKLIGAKVEKWPYSVPPSLSLNESDDSPLEDISHYPAEYEHYECWGKRLVTKRCLSKRMSGAVHCESVKTGLDKIFDSYRFMNFDRTFFELRKQLPIESSVEGRRNMMLVLVSKAGADAVKVEKLLKFLDERHSNEPENLRDAIARSLVKRAFAWRLPTTVWDLLLKWAKTTVCEILHCNILRHLLSNTTCPPSTLKSYLIDFSDLNEYSLNAAEKTCIAERLPALLISSNSAKLLLDTLNTYNRRIETVPGAEEMLIAAAREDENILRSLFKSRIARRHLFKESFKVYQTVDSYINALRHDTSVLADGESFVNLISEQKSIHDRFLRKLILYFYERDGLRARHLLALVSAMKKEYNSTFARPLAFLCKGPDSLLDYINVIGDVSSDNRKKIAAPLTANIHVCRPLIDIVNSDWQALGAKAVANAVLTCSDNDVDKYIQLCLKSKNTMRLALRLSLRSSSVMEVFAAVIKRRPTVALKVGLAYICGGHVNSDLWLLIKPIIVNIDLSPPSRTRLQRRLTGLDSIPSDIKADYWTVIFNASRKISEDKAMPQLCMIENLMPQVNDEFLKAIIIEFISVKLNKDEFVKEDSSSIDNICLYFRVIAKYLLCTKNDTILEDKVTTVCNPLFDKIEVIWREIDDKSRLNQCIDDFLLALKFSKAFLDTNYMGCIPMFEKILERLHKMWPIEKYFAKYVCLHITMLYCRSIRQAKKLNPKIFEDPNSSSAEVLNLVGIILGKYIGNEIQELVKTYFRSVIDIYQQGFLKYLREYFRYGESREKLVTAVVKGLLETEDEGLLLAEHVMHKETYYIEAKDRKEILKVLNDVKSEELKFFLYAHTKTY